MAKSNNNLLLVAGLGAAAFLFLRGNANGGSLFRRRGSVEVGPAEIVQPGSEEWAQTPDAVIDTQKQKLSVPEAVNMAKEVISQAKDALVLVKNGKKTVAIRSGRKKLPASKLKGRKVKTYKFKPKKGKYSAAQLRRVRKVFTPQNVAKMNFLGL